MESFELVKKEMEPEVNQAIAKAQEVSVANYDDNAKAAVFVGDIKAIYDKAEARRKKMKAPALETCQEIDSFFKEFTAPLSQAIDIVKRKQRNWFLAEQKKQAETEAKARAKAAEEERKERERLQAQADAARAKGKDEKADMLEAKAETVFIPPVITPAAAPKTTQANGYASTFVSDISLELTDIKAVAQGVINGTYPHYFLSVDMTKAKRYFRDMKTAPGPQPGFMIYADATVRSGRSK